MQITRERLLLGIFIALLILILLIGVLVGLLFQGGLRQGETTIGETPLAQAPADSGQPAGGGFAPIPPQLLPTNPSTGEQITQEVENPGGPDFAPPPADTGDDEAEQPPSDDEEDNPPPQPTNTPRPTSPPVRTVAPTRTPTPSGGGGGGSGGGSTPAQEPTATPTGQPTEVPTDVPTEAPTTPPPPSLELPTDPLARVNAYRTLAGVPPITENPDMSFGALKHAEYMVGNRRLTYSEEVGNPLYTAEGAAAAGKSNLWYGNGIGLWQPWEPIDEWMESPFHRLWILYPQAAEMGFGFHEGQSPIKAGGGSAAVLQVFGGWDTSIPFISPLKYPADGQQDIPPTRFGVSLQFPVYTPNPTFTLVTWVDEDGNAVPFDQIDPSNHVYMQNYGNAIFLMPVSNLSPSTTYTVRVVGTYNGKAFDLEWSFTTGG